jgi:hypothetical protein
MGSNSVAVRAWVIAAPGVIAADWSWCSSDMPETSQ